MQENNGWPKQGDVFIVYGDGHGEVQSNGKRFIWTAKAGDLWDAYQDANSGQDYVDNLN